MSETGEIFSQKNWRKPAKSIKLVVKKRARKANDKSLRILKRRNVNSEEETQQAGQLKRHNPFGCSASKKASITKFDNNGENVKLFNALDHPVVKKLTSKVTHLPEWRRDFDSNNEDDTKVSVKCLTSKRLPVDWSLKTRVRFTSSCPFNWCSKLLGRQEATGVCDFIQCHDSDNKDNATCFQKNIMYWIHPTLPWLSLFPRLSSDVKLTSKVPNVADNQDIADALQASWSQSFRSLFNLLRCGYCDYFYLCSAQFTMLFRAATIGGCSSTSAFITPTTKGIRDSFDKEGISYTLPILDVPEKTSNDGSDDEDTENNDPLTNDADDDACWLESMGVGKETLPQLQQSKLNQQRVKLRNIDHQGSSLAVVTGSHTQALFNFLLNNKTLISNTGSHAGIPPTLLAPVAFDGATLHSLAAKHGMIKQGKNLEQRYSLDITGPILPGNFSKLCQLFTSTQDNQFFTATKSLQATAPFNVQPPDTHAARYCNDENILKQSSNLGTTSLTFLKCEDGLYSWETS